MALKLQVKAEKKEAGFVWKKLSKDDREEFLSNMLLEDGVSKANINRLVVNLNNIYVLSRKIRENMIYKYVIEPSKENITQFQRNRVLHEFIKFISKKSYIVPIVLDKKKYYNDELISNYYYPFFYELLKKSQLSENLVNNYDESPSIISEMNAYEKIGLDDEIISLSGKFDNNMVFYDKNVLSSEILSSNSNKATIRFADLMRKISGKKDENIIDKIIKDIINKNPNFIIDIPGLNNNKKLDTEITLRGAKYNIIGFYSNFYLIVDDGIAIYNKTPNLIKKKYISYLENEQKQLLNSGAKISNIDDSKAVENELSEYYNPKLYLLGQDVGFDYLEKNENLDVNDLQYNYVIQYLKEINDIINERHLRYLILKKSEDIKNLVLKNNKIIDTYFAKLSEGLKFVSYNFVYILADYFSVYYRKIFKVAKKMLVDEFGINNYKELHDIIKLLNNAETKGNFNELYKGICKNNKMNALCVDNKRDDILKYKISVFKSLIRIHNRYIKLSEMRKNIREGVIYLIEKVRLFWEKNDIYRWLIMNTLGEKVYEDAHEKSDKNGKLLYENLSNSQQNTIDTYVKNVDKLRAGIAKVMNKKNPAYKLRIMYDSSSISDKKYNALELLYKNYAIHELTQKMQYPYVDFPEFDLICEHEMILLRIYKEKSQEKIKSLRDKLEHNFYGNSVEDDRMPYVVCKYCARIITNTELKIHTTFGKEGQVNMGYGKTEYSALDTKMMKQIDMMLCHTNLVYKDRIANNITGTSIYSSINGMIKEHITDDDMKKLEGFSMDKSIDLGRKINRLIATYSLGKIIFEIENSNGNIYPRGGRDEIENNQNDVKKMLEYLINWAVRRLLAISYLPKIYTKDQIKDLGVRKILLRTYNSIRKQDRMAKKYVINTAFIFEENSKNEEILANIIKILNTHSVTKLSSRVAKYNNKLTQSAYDGIINKYSFDDLRKISRYFCLKIFSSYNKNVQSKFLNRKLKENPDNLEGEKLNEVYLKEESILTFIDFINRTQLTSYYDNKYIQFIDLAKISELFSFNFRKYVVVKKKYYNYTKIRALTDRLDEKYKSRYHSIAKHIDINTLAMQEYHMINYFQLHCIDNTSHMFNDNVCVNCGQTLKELEKPKQEYVEIMRKIFGKIKKEEIEKSINLIPIPHVKLITADKNKLKFYEEFDINNKIQDITSFIIKNNNVDNSTLKSEEIRKIRSENDKAALADILINIGKYSKKYHEEKENKTIGVKKIDDIFLMMRVNELIDNINSMIQYYSILKYNKLSDSVKMYSNAYMLVDYIDNGIILDVDLRFYNAKNDNYTVNDLIKNIYGMKNVESKVKMNIILALFIELLHAILYKNPSKKTAKGRNNSTLLANFGLQLIDLFVNAQNINDITKRDLINLELEEDLLSHRKKTKFMNMTMEEKIEKGILTQSFEEQEQFYSEFLFDDLGVSAVVDESDDFDNFDEKSRNSIYDDGVDLTNDYDYDAVEDDFPYEADEYDYVNN